MCVMVPCEAGASRAGEGGVDAAAKTNCGSGDQAASPSTSLTHLEHIADVCIVGVDAYTQAEVRHLRRGTSRNERNSQHRLLTQRGA